MGEYKEINTVYSPGADFSRKESRFLSLKLFCINNQKPIFTGFLKIIGAENSNPHIRISNL